MDSQRSSDQPADLRQPRPAHGPGRGRGTHESHRRYRSGAAARCSSPRWPQCNARQASGTNPESSWQQRCQQRFRAPRATSATAGSHRYSASMLRDGIAAVEQAWPALSATADRGSSPAAASASARRRGPRALLGRRCAGSGARRHADQCGAVLHRLSQASCDDVMLCGCSGGLEEISVLAAIVHDTTPISTNADNATHQGEPT
jgi:hypothetical protein